MTIVASAAPFTRDTSDGGDHSTSAMVSLDIAPGILPTIPGGETEHHITIIYLGKNVPTSTMDQVHTIAKAVAGTTPPLSGTLGGLGTFPPSAGSDGKVPVWVAPNVPGIEALRPPFDHLNGSEHKDFNPHATLAYQDEGDPLPEQVPPTPVTFTHLTVHDRGKLTHYPFTGGDRKDWGRDLHTHGKMPYVPHPKAKASDVPQNRALPTEKWVDPPDPTGHGHRAGGYTAVGITNTALGDAVEGALRNYFGMDNEHPGRRQGPLDVTIGSDGYEVKAVSTAANEYKAKPKKAEVESKVAYAKEHNLHPNTMVVVYSPAEKQLYAYSKPGIGAYRLTSPENGWTFHGTVPLDLGDSPIAVRNWKEWDLLHPWLKKGRNKGSGHAWGEAGAAAEHAKHPEHTFQSPASQMMKGETYEHPDEPGSRYTVEGKKSDTKGGVTIHTTGEDGQKLDHTFAAAEKLTVISKQQAYKPFKKETPEEREARKAAEAEAKAKQDAEDAAYAESRKQYMGGYADRDLHEEGVWEKKSYGSRYGTVMFNGEGRVLVREPLNHFDGYNWTFPKGHPDRSETPAITAIRETEEETGLTPNLVGHVPGGFGGTGSMNHYYLAHDSGNEYNPDMLNGETSTLLWATPEQADEMMQEGTNVKGVHRDREILRAAQAAHAEQFPGHAAFPPLPELEPLPPPKPFVHSSAPIHFSEEELAAFDTGLHHAQDDAAEANMTANEARSAAKAASKDAAEAKDDKEMKSYHKGRSEGFYSHAEKLEPPPKAKQYKQGKLSPQDKMKASGYTPKGDVHQMAHDQGYAEAFAAAQKKGLDSKQAAIAGSTLKQGLSKVKGIGKSALKGQIHGLEAFADAKLIEESVGYKPKRSSTAVFIRTTKMTKSESRYRPATIEDVDCTNCIHVQRHGVADSTCAIVQGTVDHEHVCDHFDSATRKAWGRDLHHFGVSWTDDAKRPHGKGHYTKAGRTDLAEAWQRGHSEVNAAATFSHAHAGLKGGKALSAKEHAAEARKAALKSFTAPMKLKDKKEREAIQAYYEGRAHAHHDLAKTHETVEKGILGFAGAYRASVAVIFTRNWKVWNEEHPYIPHPRPKHATTAEEEAAAKKWGEAGAAAEEAKQAAMDVAKGALPKPKPVNSITFKEEAERKKLMERYENEAKRIPHGYAPGSVRATYFEQGYVNARINAHEYKITPHHAHELSLAHDEITNSMKANQARAKREGAAAGFHAHSIGYGEEPISAPEIAKPTSIKEAMTTSMGAPSVAPIGKTPGESILGPTPADKTKYLKGSPKWKAYNASYAHEKSFAESQHMPEDEAIQQGLSHISEAAGATPKQKTSTGIPTKAHHEGAAQAYTDYVTSLPKEPKLEEAKVEAPKPSVAPIGHVGPVASQPNGNFTEADLSHMTKKAVGSKFSNGDTVPNTGSNGGQWYEDAEGNGWLVKNAQSDEHAMNEVAGSLAYEEAGLYSPDVRLVTMKNGSLRAASKYIPGLKPILSKKDATPEVQAEARKGMGIDALMSHYDLTGLYNPNSDHVDGPNLFVNPEGKVVRVDLGGTGRFRAQGGPKASWKVGDWASAQGNGAKNDYNSIRNGDQGTLAYGKSGFDYSAKAGGAVDAAKLQAANFDLGAYKQSMLDAGLTPKFVGEQLDVMQARQQYLKQQGYGTSSEEPSEAKIEKPALPFTPQPDTVAVYTNHSYGDSHWEEKADGSLVGMYHNGKPTGGKYGPDDLLHSALTKDNGWTKTRVTPTTAKPALPVLKSWTYHGKKPGTVTHWVQQPNGDLTGYGSDGAHVWDYKGKDATSLAAGLEKGGPIDSGMDTSDWRPDAPPTGQGGETYEDGWKAGKQTGSNMELDSGYTADEVHAAANKLKTDVPHPNDFMKGMINGLHSHAGTMEEAEALGVPNINEGAKTAKDLRPGDKIEDLGSVKTVTGVSPAGPDQAPGSVEVELESQGGFKSSVIMHPDFEPEYVGHVPPAVPESSATVTGKPELMGGRRLENTEGTSNKFYESLIHKTPQGTYVHTTRYGSMKPGAHVTTKTKTYDSYVEATHAEDKVISTRLKHGYHDTDGPVANEEMGHSIGAPATQPSVAPIGPEPVFKGATISPSFMKAGDVYKLPSGTVKTLASKSTFGHEGGVNLVNTDGTHFTTTENAKLPFAEKTGATVSSVGNVHDTGPSPAGTKWTKDISSGNYYVKNPDGSIDFMSGVGGNVLNKNSATAEGTLASLGWKKELPGREPVSGAPAGTTWTEKDAKGTPILFEKNYDGSITSTMPNGEQHTGTPDEATKTEPFLEEHPEHWAKSLPGEAPEAEQQSQDVYGVQVTPEQAQKALDKYAKANPDNPSGTGGYSIFDALSDSMDKPISHNTAPINGTNFTDIKKKVEAVAAGMTTIPSVDKHVPGETIDESEIPTSSGAAAKYAGWLDPGDLVVNPDTGNTVVVSDGAVDSEDVPGDVVISGTNGAGSSETFSIPAKTVVPTNGAVTPNTLDLFPKPTIELPDEIANEHSESYISGHTMGYNTGQDMAKEGKTPQQISAQASKAYASAKQAKIQNDPTKQASSLGKAHGLALASNTHKKNIESGAVAAPVGKSKVTKSSVQAKNLKKGDQIIYLGNHYTVDGPYLKNMQMLPTLKDNGDSLAHTFPPTTKITKLHPGHPQFVTPGAEPAASGAVTATVWKNPKYPEIGTYIKWSDGSFSELAPGAHHAIPTASDVESALNSPIESWVKSTVSGDSAEQVLGKVYDASTPTPNLTATVTKWTSPSVAGGVYVQNADGSIDHYVHGVLKNSKTAAQVKGGAWINSLDKAGGIWDKDVNVPHPFPPDAPQTATTWTKPGHSSKGYYVKTADGTITHYSAGGNSMATEPHDGDWETTLNAPGEGWVKSVGPAPATPSNPGTPTTPTAASLAGTAPAPPAAAETKLAFQPGGKLKAKAAPVKFTSDFDSNGEPFHKHPGYHNEAYDAAYNYAKGIENPSNADLAAADKAQQSQQGTEENAAAKGTFNGLQAAQIAWAKAHKSEAKKQQEKEYIQKVEGSYTSKEPFVVNDADTKAVPNEIPHGTKPSYGTAASSVGYDQAIAQGYDQAVAAYLQGHSPEQIQYAVEEYLNKADAVGTDLTDEPDIMEQAHFAGLAQGAGKAAVDLQASGGDIEGHHPNASSKSVLSQGVLADKSGKGAYKATGTSGNPFKDNQSSTQLSFTATEKDAVRTWKGNYRYSKGAAYVKALDKIGNGIDPGNGSSAQSAKKIVGLYIAKAEPNTQAFQRKVSSSSIPASQLKEWKTVGAVTNIPLTSWSTDPNAWHGNVWLHAPPGTVSMDIGRIENYGSEVETISGGHFKVVKVEQKGSITHIYLDQLEAAVS